MGSGGLKAACLLVCGAVSLPSWLLGLIPVLVPTGWKVGVAGLGPDFNKQEGGFQNIP